MSENNMAYDETQFKADVPPQAPKVDEGSAIYTALKIILIVICGIALLPVIGVVLLFIFCLLAIGADVLILHLPISSLAVMLGTNFMKKSKVKSTIVVGAFVILIVSLALGGYFHEARGLSCSLQGINWVSLQFFS